MYVWTTHVTLIYLLAGTVRQRLSTHGVVIMVPMKVFFSMAFYNIVFYPDDGECLLKTGSKCMTT